MEPKYNLSPIVPGTKNMGPLRDLAQEVIAASAGFEGRAAGETVAALGEKLRLINSYYSNLIEGHKKTISDIEKAREQNFSRDPERKYAQELCVAHVRAEKELTCRGGASGIGKPSGAVDDQSAYPRLAVLFSRSLRAVRDRGGVSKALAT